MIDTIIENWRVITGVCCGSGMMFFIVVMYACLKSGGDMDTRMGIQEWQRPKKKE